MNPNKDDLYKGINNLPLTECLEDTYARVIPYWENSIKPLVLKNTTIISAHGNSLRALCKYLFDVSDEDITSLEIPTANPLVISLNNSCKIHSASYLDASRAQKLPIIGE
jgi:2,3-bisphosphoglycerate-dependent phosphoglycerate mutase